MARFCCRAAGVQTTSVTSVLPLLLPDCVRTLQQKVLGSLSFPLVSLRPVPVRSINVSLREFLIARPGGACCLGSKLSSSSCPTVIAPTFLPGALSVCCARCGLALAARPPAFDSATSVWFTSWAEGGCSRIVCSLPFLGPGAPTWRKPCRPRCKLALNSFLRPPQLCGLRSKIQSRLLSSFVEPPRIWLHQRCGAVWLFGFLCVLFLCP